jgi:hypothetical protein
MVQTKIWQMTLFQNLILFTNHCGNLQEMLEMASFLKYVDLYLTSEGPVLRGTPCIYNTDIFFRKLTQRKRWLPPFDTCFGNFIHNCDIFVFLRNVFCSVATSSRALVYPLLLSTRSTYKTQGIL